MLLYTMNSRCIHFPCPQPTNNQPTNQPTNQSHTQGELLRPLHDEALPFTHVRSTTLLHPDGAAPTAPPVWLLLVAVRGEG